jgi:hypothetical protein
MEEIELSGDDLLTAFVYTLVRDYVTSGVVEGIMLKLPVGGGKLVTYSNGWLLLYARDVADRLRGLKPIETNKVALER